MIGPGHYTTFIRDLTLIPIPCLAVFSAALPALAVRKPRPPFRRMWSQPGIAGCLAATVAWAMPWAYEWIVDYWLHHETNYIFLVSNYMGQAGVVVATTWLILALNRRWKALPNWLDRSGRVLCILWLVLPLIHESTVFWELD